MTKATELAPQQRRGQGGIAFIKVTSRFQGNSFIISATSLFFIRFISSLPGTLNGLILQGRLCPKTKTILNENSFY